ncbi:M50 family metallopeptidase [Bailinhaonella thermotolerans]|uniref:RIP metalloprotease n=1 Tax=Bailinhaonella thermotolerans TaxID=1070861 RepID=A0A3A4A256_9ACTN|nr:M50 family metallopeptidase [Bailinhaonella thermotolerans]RJL22756.1 RIP metalloprotease [Bailinhaonella thermotolerans]
MDWLDLGLNLAGVVIFFVGMMLSIGLHEIGHMVPAKLFGVRVPQYMVGFGPTLWSRRRGETEYGIKWIPLGGYVRMIGMLPPRKGDEPGKLRSGSTGPFQGLIENARQVSLEEIRPGDEDRVFYKRKWWQKVIIMAGGPAMNFVLAIGLFAVVLMGFGIKTEQPVVKSVSQCVIPATEIRDCRPGDPATPAANAGLRAGDRIVEVAGRPVKSWEEATRRIRAHGAGATTIGVERGGQRLTLNATLIAQDRPKLDDPDKLERVGFLGVSPTFEYVPQGPAAVAQRIGELTAHTAQSLVRFPEKMVGVWNAAFGGAERDINGPVGVVGAGRIGGEILASEAPAKDKMVLFLNLLAGFNLAIGMFNLIPLLPLDGGHIAGALWEGLRRFIARVFRRPDPGHVDVARLLPLTYAVAAVFVVMAGLLLYADLVNPIRLTG